MHFSWFIVDACHYSLVPAATITLIKTIVAEEIIFQAELASF
ncbi:hypothetical protein [Pontibacter burrus]|nr:hypothetical protein [Pontibacter burrus]